MAIGGGGSVGNLCGGSTFFVITWERRKERVWVNIEEIGVEKVGQSVIQWNTEPGS